ncbi:dynein light chain Tctex-type protein 2B-like [Microplitis mediator]|uniref:dynein light chain Tctex-type protein 2B-like n=1 Tax=Microplitis mediator TaxID=375433 RepID=UPI002552D100|nr:dynein light chain Tctex-type protein 2B-like [Microplitis mediator]
MSKTSDKQKTTLTPDSESSSDKLLKNKKDSNNEVLNDDDERSQPSYQISPQLLDKFKPQVVKEIIHDVLHDQLSTKVYSVQDANKWGKEISDIIKNKVKELKFKEYKYVVNVVLGEQRGAGVKIGTRCLWDAEADDYAHGNFINESLFCVVCVYAVFLY